MYSWFVILEAGTRFAMLTVTTGNHRTLLPEVRERFLSRAPRNAGFDLTTRSAPGVYLEFTFGYMNTLRPNNEV